MIDVGGVIAVDNVLYPVQYRPMMEKLIEHIKNKPNVQTVTIPIGNGEELSIKTKM
jgi:predicted O-methyltransferase YrrM